MTINTVSGRTSFLASSIVNLKSQLDVLSLQMNTGKKATTYAGLGLDGSIATGLRAQVERNAGFSSTQTLLTGRINIANLSLQGISKAGSEVKSAAQSGTITFDSAGQTPGQKIALGSFAQTISLLNSDAGGRQLFSGRATDTPSTAAATEIMDGVSPRAGLKQVINERRQADLGVAANLGRVVVSAVAAAPASTFSVSEDVAPSLFGLKLRNVTSTLSGGTPPAGPTGTPPAIAFDLGAVNPNAGENVKFSFTLPDGSIEEFTLTASTQSPLPAGTFAIGATANDTAVNLRNAIRSSLNTLSNTSLVAASAVKASDEFFSSNPPLRVVPPAAPATLASATALANGTPANTVFWYTGEDGPVSDPARGTAVAQIDQSVTVQYGIRANERAIVDQLKNIAVYAAVSTVPGDPNATAQITALNSRLVQNLSVHPGVQGIPDIQTDLANAQATIKTVQDRQTQTGGLAESMLDSIQNVTREEVAVKMLAVQTSLQASFQTTSSLYQLSLVNFMPIN